MIVEFFDYGDGFSKGPLDYLLGKKRNRCNAKLLTGSEREVAELIDISPYEKKYTCGCLSFSENDLSEEARKKIMAEFEKCLFPGMDQSQYRVLWIEHKDKLNKKTGEKRLELNFLIPNLEVNTGKRLQPFYHEVDLPRVDLFKKLVNYKYGLHDPDDPINRQPVTTKKSLPKKIEDIKAVIDIEAQKAIEAGLITDRVSMKRWLVDLGLEITREKPQSLSIKNPHSDNTNARPIRLTGAIYEQNFRITAESTELTRQVSEKYRREAAERYKANLQRYRAYAERKSIELEQQYRQYETEPRGSTQASYDSSIDVYQDEYSSSSQDTDRHERAAGSELQAVQPLKQRNSKAIESSQHSFEIEYRADFSSVYSAYFSYRNERNQLREIHPSHRAQSANSSHRQRYSSENTRADGFIQSDSQRIKESQIEQTHEYRSTVINDYRRSAEEARRCFEHYSKKEYDDRTARQIQKRIAGESGNFDRLSKETNSSPEGYSISRFIRSGIESVKNGLGQSFEALDRLIRHQIISVDRDQIIDRDAIQSIQRAIEHSATEYAATFATAGQTSSRTRSEADQTAVNERARSSTEVSAR